MSEPFDWLANFQPWHSAAINAYEARTGAKFLAGDGFQVDFLVALPIDVTDFWSWAKDNGFDAGRGYLAKLGPERLAMLEKVRANRVPWHRGPFEGVIALPTDAPAGWMDANMEGSPR